MLKQIIEVKQEEIKTLEKPVYTGKFTSRSLIDAIKDRSRDVALIAEVKKASPSKGVIRKDFDPVAIAVEYASSQVDAISVITDRTFFQGNPTFLTQIKRAVDLPILRKDFIIDRIQLEESKAIGADAVLLIAAALQVEKAKELYEYASELGLEVLLEVHTEEELMRILDFFTPDLIGINNRNLETFDTNLENTLRISRMLPDHIPFVSESGIQTNADIQYVKKVSASAVLVGESLMKSKDINEAVCCLLEDRISI
ncbi:indole-3-glycerol phosphate synthase TrpC [Alkalihalobacillus sp. AL-G]|uniref:indole-3-glycerol phosphate synthase TrpC n=1 Tax=Alkalihalobacillus sp. AL-G TaxID=2926399 RepID=UPI0027297F9A|nr:indole-3-glycerol phosphate synthase TrpC [Alkalihalobacillus sp. AL-G]WLD95407.1 indole-3-glycerol phosphate synthase TrpC [Alkalihalobacillus sp. AL-G]